MKWVKILLVSLIAIVITGCSGGVGSTLGRYENATWSLIMESDNFRLFECYEFHGDGHYEYYFYKNDPANNVLTFDYDEGRYNIYDLGLYPEYELHGDWGTETYDKRILLEGMVDDNSLTIVEHYEHLVREILMLD